MPVVLDAIGREMAGPDRRDGVADAAGRAAGPAFGMERVEATGR